MALETEIKLLVPENAIPLIKQMPLLCTAQKQGKQYLHNWYYDTPDLRLSADKVALRIREHNGAYIQTLKTKGQSVNGLHQRGEWEWLIDKPELDTRLLAEADCAFAIQGMSWEAELEVIFVTHFERTLWMIESTENAAVIEVALDQGEVSYTSSQGKTYMDKICELELELKSGEIEDLIMISEIFTAAIPELVTSNVSKAERGYRLFNQAHA